MLNVTTWEVYRQFIRPWQICGQDPWLADPAPDKLSQASWKQFPVLNNKVESFENFIQFVTPTPTLISHGIVDHMSKNSNPPVAALVRKVPTDDTNLPLICPHAVSCTCASLARNLQNIFFILMTHFAKFWSLCCQHLQSVLEIIHTTYPFHKGEVREACEISF